MNLASRLSGVLAAASALTVSTIAHADNTESFFYSDDAALAGGAVIATTRDSGAIWYQPAGIGGTRRSQIDLSASAFGVRIRRVPDALGTRLPGGRQSISLDSVDVFSAPHAIGLVRNLSDRVAIGFGLFVTLREVRNAESEIDVTGPALTDPTTSGRFRQRLDIGTEQTRYHFGPAVGWEIIDGLRVGASVFGTYGKATSFAQYFLAEESTGASGASKTVALVQQRIGLGYFGGQAQAGVQWEPTPEWSLGLLVRSPELLFSASANGAGISAAASGVAGAPAEIGYGLEKPEAKYPAFTIIAPARVIVGGARMLGRGAWISAEADLQAPFSNQGIEQTTVINVRAGTRFGVSDNVTLGFGVFSDRATSPRLADSFADERIDDYGITGGAQLRTPLSLAGRDATDPLVLSTTLAIKYAVGIGTFRATDIDLTSDAAPPTRAVDVVYHQIVPYIGSGVVF